MLFEVTCHDHFRTFTHTSKKHLHLIRGGVLHFICDDEGVLEGSSTHVCEGANFDNFLFDHVLNVILCIIFTEDVHDGSCPWIHFFFHGSWKKTDVLLYGDDWTSQYNPFICSVVVSLYGCTTCQHRFPRPRWSHCEYHGFADTVQHAVVISLIVTLRNYNWMYFLEFHLFLEIFSITR